MDDVERKVLIAAVDEDLDIQDLIVAYFMPRGFRVQCFSDPVSALQESKKTGSLWDVLLTDFHFQEMSGDEFSLRLKSALPDLPVIPISSKTSSPTQPRSTPIAKVLGNAEILPICFAKLHSTIESTLDSKSKSIDSHGLNLKSQSISGSPKMIGRSPAFLSALDLARRVATSTANVFITGESGTGKELFARYIHDVSNRKLGPFIAINCSAIPEGLLESELFGHVKGAFTGAQEGRIGLFEEAQRGTLFLDEIGDLSLLLQAKLLRVVQERIIKRIGENIFRPIDCRIISATHKDLSLEVTEKRFREDLYYRLDVVPILIPPLRQRQEDLIPLSDSFLRKYAVLNHSPLKTLSKEALRFMISNPWRGNVRELENTIERAVVLSSHSEIQLEDFIPLSRGLGPIIRPHDGIDSDDFFQVDCSDMLPTLDEVIRLYINFAVHKKGGARDKTAIEIGVDRKTLYKRLRADSAQIV